MKRIRFMAVIIAIASLLASCTQDKDNTPEISKITLSTDSDLSNVMEDDAPITFIAKDDKDEDITNRCIFYANAKVISNIFKPENVGKYAIKAEYKGVTSNVININVLDNPDLITFKQNALIEDYTGTWCGWCPRVMYAIDKVHEKTDAAVVVAVHAGDILANKTLYNTLKESFDVKGFPTAIINRKSKWKAPEYNNITQVTNLAGKKSLLGLSISAKIEAGKLIANVSVKFSQTYDDLKLVVVVLENGYKEDQKNYTSFYGGSDVLKDFSHNHVLRESLTSIMGDAIPKAESVKGKEYVKDFNVDIPSNISNKNHIEVVAFVVQSDKSVVNVRSCKTNEEQQFEEL